MNDYLKTQRTETLRRLEEMAEKIEKDRRENNTDH